MFQSSRIASGNARRHVSIASSPFSASVIWKSSPSSMRRATLRLTLESSTIMPVSIVSSLSAARTNPLRFSVSLHSQPWPIDMRSRGRRLGAEVEHPVDVEHDKKLSIEPEHARRYAGKLAIEIDGVRFAGGFRQFEYFAYRFDQKPERFGPGFDTDRHRRRRLAV